MDSSEIKIEKIAIGFTGNPAVFFVHVKTGSREMERISVVAEISAPGAGSPVFRHKKETQTGDHGIVEIPADIADAIAWSAENPVLYEVKISIYKNNILADSNTFSFGIAVPGCRENGFFLNNEKLFIKAIKIDNPEMINRNVFEDLKDTGFNAVMVTVAEKIEESARLADGTGLMVIAEIEYNETEKLAILQHLKNVTAQKLIEDCFNYPSILCWHINYRFVVEDFRNIEEEFLNVIRETDRNRIFIVSYVDKDMGLRCSKYSVPDNDGWKEFNLIDVPNVFGRTEDAGGLQTEKCSIVCVGIENSTNTADFLRKEFLRQKNDAGLDEYLVDMAELELNGLSEVISQTQSNNNISGYVVNPLIQHYLEFAGASTGKLIREMEKKEISRINSDFRIFFGNRKFQPGRKLSGEIYLVNNSSFWGEVTVTKQVKSPRGKFIYSDKRNVFIKSGREDCGRMDVNLKHGQGSYEVRVTAAYGEKILSEYKDKVRVFEKAKKKTRKNVYTVGEANNRCSIENAECFVVPPISENFYDYPIPELVRVFSRTKEGGTCVIFSPPDGLAEFAFEREFFPAHYRVRETGLDSVMVFSREHPFLKDMSEEFFEAVYGELRPATAITEFSGTPVISSVRLNSGAFSGTVLGTEKCGNGRIVFCNLNLYPFLHEDPVVSLFENIINTRGS